MQVAEIQKKIEPILRSYGVKRAGIFGSHARGDARDDSDVDLLVQLGKPMGMIAYMRFVEEIERALQRSTDIVTERSLNKFMRPHVEADLQTIYES
ncbi:MAG: nucleotidyltransferase domain-containing protein [bacterium]|nr:nucleotidyltransferase domain-containing protein [bacterium]